MSPRTPRFRVADDVAWVTTDDLADESAAEAAYVTLLPSGPPVVLEGPACAVWAALVPGGTVAEVARRVAETADVTADEITDDVSGFLHRLVELGLAVPDAG